MPKVARSIQAPVFGGLHNLVCEIRPLLEANGYNVVAVVPNTDDEVINRMASMGVEVCPIKMTRLRRSGNPATQYSYLTSFRSEVGSCCFLLPDGSRFNFIQVVYTIDMGLQFPSHFVSRGYSR